MEGKGKLLKQIDYEKSEIFDMIDRRGVQILVERVNSAEYFGTVSEELRQGDNVQDVHQFLVREFFAKAEIKLVPEHQYGLINLVLMLCKFPAGLC